MPVAPETELMASLRDVRLVALVTVAFTVEAVELFPFKVKENVSAAEIAVIFALVDLLIRSGIQSVLNIFG